MANPLTPRAESVHVGQVWIWAGVEYRVEQIENDCARVERVDDHSRWAWLPLKQFDHEHICPKGSQ